MPRIEGSVEVAAPREVVWEFMSDPTNHVGLGGFLSDVVKQGTGEWGEGSVFRERSGPGPLKSWSEWTVVRFDPPVELVHRSEEGSLTATGIWKFNETDHGTTAVTQIAAFDVDIGFKPLQQLAEGLFTWMMRREADRALRDLRQVFDHSSQ